MERNKPGGIRPAPSSRLGAGGCRSLDENAQTRRIRARFANTASSAWVADSCTAGDSKISRPDRRGAAPLDADALAVGAGVGLPAEGAVRGAGHGITQDHLQGMVVVDPARSRDRAEAL